MAAADIDGDGYPEIVVLESTPEHQFAAELWHSDVTWRVEPSLGSILFGRRIPPYGGDTVWADMELAYDLLDDETKDDDVRVVKDKITVVVDAMSLQYLMGAEIDYEDKLDGARFVIRNPNASSTCGCGSSFNV